MEISSLNQVAKQSAVKTEKTISKEEFLKLFTLQLKYQNPLNPMDNTEFTAQLAQFSSLEQLTNINSQIKNLVMYQNSLQNTLAAGLIGKEVGISGDEIRLAGSATGGFVLNTDTPSAKISIYDLNGRLLREDTMTYLRAGNNTYVWDGRDNAGTRMPDGSYRMKVEATDLQGRKTDAETLSYGTVTGIRFVNNTTRLVIGNGRDITMSDIYEIKGGI